MCSYIPNFCDFSDCAYAVLETTQFCHSPDEVKVESPHRVIEREMLVEDYVYSGPKRVGYYCQKCRRIFKPFYAYINHLVEGSICADLPDPEQVDVSWFVYYQSHSEISDYKSFPLKW